MCVLDPCMNGENVGIYMDISWVIWWHFFPRYLSQGLVMDKGIKHIECEVWSLFIDESMAIVGQEV